MGPCNSSEIITVTNELIHYYIKHSGLKVSGLFHKRRGLQIIVPSWYDWERNKLATKVSRPTRLTDRCRSAAGAANKHWEREKSPKGERANEGWRRENTPAPTGTGSSQPASSAFQWKKKAVRPRGNTQEQLILAQEKRQRWNRPRSKVKIKYTKSDMPENAKDPLRGVQNMFQCVYICHK
ncbi:hypothetical protein NDU88_004835 [Pleurodeles waltl]|uniref:Uncharacterized protein n=1 Tax=Pleurodeles waltl TaxID=8319 RepID=A0AAV7WWV5_PLEWA|nr:hypothetical protein NDU88_004835 [Pleurodeles waltl]